MARNNREEKKPPKGSKMKMVTCTACPKRHEVPATSMVQHRKDAMKLSARQSGSRAL